MTCLISSMMGSTVLTLRPKSGHLRSRRNMMKSKRKNKMPWRNRVSWTILWLLKTLISKSKRVSLFSLLVRSAQERAVYSQLWLEICCLFHRSKSTCMLKDKAFRKSWPRKRWSDFNKTCLSSNMTKILSQPSESMEPCHWPSRNHGFRTRHWEITSYTIETLIWRSMWIPFSSVNLKEILVWWTKATSLKLVKKESIWAVGNKQD